jgi:hypothetical protein
MCGGARVYANHTAVHTRRKRTIDSVLITPNKFVVALSKGKLHDFKTCCVHNKCHSHVIALLFIVSSCRMYDDGGGKQQDPIA